MYTRVHRGSTRHIRATRTEIKTDSETKWKNVFICKGSVTCLWLADNEGMVKTIDNGSSCNCKCGLLGLREWTREWKLQLQ